MKPIDKYGPCPCDSKKPYTKCCRPFHQGQLPAAAVNLMRSRYSAYALGLADYIIDTTHKENIGYNEDLKAWKQDLEIYCRATKFDGLKIVDAQGDEAATTATVSFIAYLRQGEADASFSEKSNFTKVDGRWLYRSGEVSHMAKDQADAKAANAVSPRPPK
jgi:SEC-C motif domain protein